MQKPCFSRAVFFLGFLLLAASTLYAEELPGRISDEMFWKLSSDLSEPGGTFLSENFISNERSYQHVVPDMKNRFAPGGVYLGVGPEQNFTYIAAMQPKIAFIIDIRRQNMIELLMYKALFELSENRYQFLSRLFSKPLRGLPGNDSRFESFLSALDKVPADAALYDSTLSAIRTNLIRNHKFKLTEADLANLEHVFHAFYTSGLSTNYSGQPASTVQGRLFPSYLELLLETSSNQLSEHYLSTDRNYQTVQRMQKENRIIPLVGDFAGSGALRALGNYLRDHNAALSAFYTSNVEQYLFLDPIKWKIFYRNVASIPIEPHGVVIRALVQNPNGAFSNSPAVNLSYRMETMLFSLPDLASTFDEGGIQGYRDILETANLTQPDRNSLKIEITNLNPNVGIVVWPDLEPPAKLKLTAASDSEFVLKWPKTEQGDKTAFRISKQAGESWGTPIHLDYKAACGSDSCSFRDSNLKAGTRYCYYVQAADDYSNLDPKTVPQNEDLGDPSITVCATLSASNAR